MAEVVLDIKQWGNNLGVRLPATIAREARLYADQRVRISVKGNQVIITPVEDVDLTLAQRHGQRTAAPFPRDRYCQDQRV